MLGVVQELIESGATIDVHDNQQCTPLDLATSLGYIPIMKTLIQANANMHNNHTFGNIGAHDAAIDGERNVITVLLESGFDGQMSNDKGNMGRTPIPERVESNDVSIVQELIESGATIDVHDNQHCTPVWILQHLLGYIPIMKTLIQANADMHNNHTFGNIGAHDAAIDGERDAITVLLESGFDVNCKNKEGSTMLHLAAGKMGTEN
ncbi:serine/threonine-protein phosphatase 6 regulatory ankyrin repeat subunit A-like [Macrobrachium nipponense]|uniref:serine/threonine-protein phosphatase 6 regulatory ankyrin repeat subunit A-like n=1 Tax=Macrobrachium nipponense TaxID=159736 RepID=UPI0030C882C9